MEAMTVRELLEATGGALLNKEADLDAVVTAVETDSRKAGEGSLFVALRGEKTDGHKYIASALQNGAAGCLTEDVPETLLPGKFYIQVPNTMNAVGDVARAYKEKFPIPVIGITGSVGKTTTKDMIASVLGQRFRVLKTEGNFNNELGLPLTLFRLTGDIEICVLEMGMNHFGEIDYLTKIVRPDIAVITNIGDAHIENLGSREGILQAKSEIFNYMKPDSMAVLNGDDPLLKSLEGKIVPQTVYCGENAPYMASNLLQKGAEGLECSVKTPHNAFSVVIPALGNHMIYPVLNACAIGEHFGMTGEEIKVGIEAFVPTKMRMNVIHEGSVTILDDGYNANPQSMKAALETLSQTPAAHRVAILGSMFELGERGPALHRGIGEYAGQLGNLEAVLAVGELAQNIYDGACGSGIPRGLYAKEKEEALTLLPELVKPDSVILVKASRGMAFEVLTAEIRRLASQ